MKAFCILLCQKPIEGTFALNCLSRGCGAWWIDGGRVAVKTEGATRRDLTSNEVVGFGRGSELGRFPANVVLTELAVSLLDEQGTPHRAGNVRVSQHNIGNTVYAGGWTPTNHNPDYYGDAGGYSRLFKKFGIMERSE